MVPLQLERTKFWTVKPTVKSSVLIEGLKYVQTFFFFPLFFYLDPRLGVLSYVGVIAIVSQWTTWPEMLTCFLWIRELQIDVATMSSLSSPRNVTSCLSLNFFIYVKTNQLLLNRNIFLTDMLSFSHI